MKIISSFSGGRTSAYMTIKLKEEYQNLIVLFANTSQENDASLDFVNRCDKEYNLGVIWIEAKVFHGERTGTSYNVVDYKTACRNGSIFEDMIKKYGIPNQAYPHCTRELKLAPINSWIKKNIKENFKVAVGIRADEKDKRESKDAKKNNIFYPLIEELIFKYDINEFWKKQNFDLGLFDYQGNCKTCWKKSNKKLVMIAKEHPEYFDFNIEMETKYGLAGHNIDGNRRVFFRDNKSAQDIIEMACLDQMDIFDFINTIDEDENSGCSESCEAY